MSSVPCSLHLCYPSHDTHDLRCNSSNLYFDFGTWMQQTYLYGLILISATRTDQPITHHNVWLAVRSCNFFFFGNSDVFTRLKRVCLCVCMLPGHSNNQQSMIVLLLYHADNQSKLIRFHDSRQTSSLCFLVRLLLRPMMLLFENISRNM